MPGDMQRPYLLECFEPSPNAVTTCSSCDGVGCDDCMGIGQWKDESPRWRKWSTYVATTNALERRDKLRAKGYDARVTDTRTGEVMGDSTDEACVLCGKTHPGPYDGRCLI